MTELPTELVVLAWSVVLLLVHIGLQGALSTRERGLDWNAGPRDGSPKPLGPLASRAERALSNYRETYPALIAAILAVVLAERTGSLSAIGAWTWLVARIAYLPLYILGVPMVRSLAWTISVIGIVLILIDLF